MPPIPPGARRPRALIRSSSGVVPDNPQLSLFDRNEYVRLCAYTPNRGSQRLVAIRRVRYFHIKLAQARTTHPSELRIRW